MALYYTGCFRDKVVLLYMLKYFPLQSFELSLKSIVSLIPNSVQTVLADKTLKDDLTQGNRIYEHT